MKTASFDREEVLRSAMSAFVQKGYGKTSMQDLTRATGLHPGSIYAAFSNKRGLLLAEIEQYNRDKSAEFEAFFPGSAATLTELKNYLDHIVAECTSCESGQACLLMKALSEVMDQDQEVQAVISQNLADWQQAIGAQFERAKTRGELPEHSDSAHLARFFCMGIFGLRTFSHTQQKADVLQQLADQLYRSVCAQ